MNLVYDSDFLKKLKKVDVKVRKSFKRSISLFNEDPTDPRLNNHRLRDKYLGHRSIDVNANWRAIYKETKIGGDEVAYFVAIGTHKELYGE